MCCIYICHFLNSIIKKTDYRIEILPEIPTTDTKNVQQNLHSPQIDFRLIG